MIYLRYAYQKSGLPAPTEIGLQINDNESVQADVVDEFSMAFQGAKIWKNISKDMTCDVCILCFRNRNTILEQIKWGQRHLHQARMGVGFFCISERTLSIVPKMRFFSWAMEAWLSDTLIAILKLNIKAKKTIRQIL